MLNATDDRKSHCSSIAEGRPHRACRSAGHDEHTPAASRLDAPLAGGHLDRHGRGAACGGRAALVRAAGLTPALFIGIAVAMRPTGPVETARRGTEAA